MPTSAAVHERRRQRGRKALKVFAFCVALVLGVMLALAVLFRFAGGWGVPYFAFTTDRGSRCTNTLTGFHCDQLTMADVNYFGGVELPADSRVLSSSYVSTHDYQLSAQLEVPAAGAADAATELKDAFGDCDAGHPSPLSSARLTGLCVFANDTDVASSGTPDARVYVVATGVRPDKVRLVSMSVRSR